MCPSTHAVWNAVKVNEEGQVPRPLLAMSSKLRTATRITKTSGRTQSRRHRRHDRVEDPWTSRLAG